MTTSVLVEAEIHEYPSRVRRVERMVQRASVERSRWDGEEKRPIRKEKGEEDRSRS